MQRGDILAYFLFPSCVAACPDPVEPALTATALSLAARNSCLH